MDLFHDSKSRKCSHIFRRYYWWWLYAGLFFFPFPHLGKFCSSAFSGKCNRWALWMTAMNNWCCEPSLPTDSGPKSLLQFYDSNLSYNPFSFLPVTAEKRVHIIRSSPHFPVSHQCIPMPLRGTNWERIWEWSGAGQFSLTGQEVHTNQSFSKTNRIDRYSSNVDINLGLCFLLCYF